MAVKDTNLTEILNLIREIDSNTKNRKPSRELVNLEKKIDEITLLLEAQKEKLELLTHDRCTCKKNKSGKKEKKLKKEKADKKEKSEKKDKKGK